MKDMLLLIHTCLLWCKKDNDGRISLWYSYKLNRWLLGYITVHFLCCNRFYKTNRGRNSVSLWGREKNDDAIRLLFCPPAVKCNWCSAISLFICGNHHVVCLILIVGARYLILEATVNARVGIVQLSPRAESST